MQTSIFFCRQTLSIFFVIIFYTSSAQTKISSQSISFNSIDQFLAQFDNSVDLPDTIIPFKIKTIIVSDGDYSIYPDIKQCDQNIGEDSVLGSVLIVTPDFNVCLWEWLDGDVGVTTQVDGQNSQKIFTDFEPYRNKTQRITNYALVNTSNSELLEITVKDSNNEGRGTYSTTNIMLIDLQKELLLLNRTVKEQSAGGSLNGSYNDDCEAIYRIEKDRLILGQNDCESSSSTLNTDSIDTFHRYTTTVTHKKEFNPFTYNYQNSLLIKKGD